MRAITVVCLVLLTGCASSSQENYYKAVEAAATAQQAHYAARYDALARMAASGTPESAVAATMALALSNPQTIVPQYIESNALKWAQVLAPSAVALGGMAIQANTAKYVSNANRDVQLAQTQANQAIQLGQQGMIVDLNSQTSGGALDAVSALLPAITNAQDGTVQIGLEGLGAVSNVSATALGTVEAMSENSNSLIRGLSRDYNDLLGDTINGLAPVQIACTQNADLSVTCNGL